MLADIKNSIINVYLPNLILGVALTGFLTACGSDKTLEQAATTGDLRQVKSLVRKGANVNYVDLNTPMGKTPLIAAAEGGHADVVRYLLDQGASLEKTTFAGATALRKAAFHGHADVVNMLLQSGANPEADTDQYGRSPIVWAVLGARNVGGRPDEYANIITSLKESGSKCRKSYQHPAKGLPVEIKQLAVEVGSKLINALNLACNSGS